jgi:hypothetical protein
MFNESKLQFIAEQIYILLERGEEREAVRKLQEVQKDALVHAADMIDQTQTDTPASDLRAAIAQLPC